MIEDEYTTNISNKVEELGTLIEETVIVTTSEYNTIKPYFELFGGTGGYLKYFTKVKPGTKLQITIKELK